MAPANDSAGAGRRAPLQIEVLGSGAVPARPSRPGRLAREELVGSTARGGAIDSSAAACAARSRKRAEQKGGALHCARSRPPAQRPMRCDPAARTPPCGRPPAPREPRIVGQPPERGLERLPAASSSASPPSPLCTGIGEEVATTASEDANGSFPSAAACARPATPRPSHRPRLAAGGEHRAAWPDVHCFAARARRVHEALRVARARLHRVAVERGGMVLAGHQRPALQRFAVARHGRQARPAAAPSHGRGRTAAGQEQGRVLLRQAAQAARLGSSYTADSEPAASARPCQGLGESVHPGRASAELPGNPGAHTTNVTAASAIIRASLREAAVGFQR